MNELLKVEINENHEQIISGRVLHQFLGIGAEYAKWFERKCEFGFIENTDYKTVFYGKDLSEREKLGVLNMEIDYLDGVGWTKIKDKVGGYHKGGLGWSPDGTFCGECPFASCEGV